MELVALAIPIAIIIGLIRGGRLQNLTDAPLTALWAAFLGFFLRFLANSPDLMKSANAVWLINLIPAINILAYVFIFLFCVKNISLPGIKGATVGAFLNIAVIVANGGKMPFQITIAANYDSFDKLMQSVRDGAPYIVDNYNAPLWFLGDWIPFPGLWYTYLVSIGDFILLAALIYIIEELVAKKYPQEVSPYTP